MHERISVNAICFPKASLADQAGYWRALEAKRVSFISPPLLADGVKPALDALKTGRYGVETIAHGPLISGHLSRHEETWRDGRKNISQLIVAAKELGARSIYVLSGGHGSLTWEEAAECFSAAIKPCVAEAKAAGVLLLVENTMAMNADFHIAHTLRDVVTLSEMADIGINIDLYGCWAEAGLRESIGRALPRCHLVQLSDYVYGDRSFPSRAVAGDGAIPFERILDWMLTAGYKGTFDLELLGPRIDKEGHFDAVRRTADYLGEVLQKLGA